ncbi:hypothetical protein [Hyalangium rubrum]|uniref:Lipoprotein n=1 Tax=Hyalangium rubrum TaxID=3103134 RepID=A0ABU5HIN0_9BACT|nr:hypothetical protein [Hyalangium sp. s54d21]MDY7233216.1 hypothetical protein [Hyalangium sp. s54d21]
MSTLSKIAGLVGLLALGAATACGEQSIESEPGDLRFSFESDAEGWRGAFADYPSGREQDFGLAFEHRALPAELGTPGKALFLEGDNRSDDLFMYLTREVTGLSPNTSYALSFEVVLASNAGSGCTGIGGAPGESVYLKVGASPAEPRAVVDSGGVMRLDLDKGNQSNGGANAQVIGNVANGVPQCPAPYRLVTRTNTDSPFVISTGEQGSLWLLVGTDSGFEGTSSLYYDSIRVLLEPR